MIKIISRLTLVLYALLLVGLLYQEVGATGQSLTGVYHGIGAGGAVLGHVLIWGSNGSAVQDGGVAPNTAGPSLMGYDYLPATNSFSAFPTSSGIVCGPMVPDGSFTSTKVVIGVQTIDASTSDFYDVCVYNSTGSSLVADLGTGSQGVNLTGSAIPRVFSWHQGTVSFVAGTQYHVCFTGSAAVAHLFASLQTFDHTTATTSTSGQCPASVTFAGTYAINAAPGLKFMP